jgi:hypothetical protein
MTDCDKKLLAFFFILSIFIFLMGCAEKEVQTPERESKIPAGALKMTPETDASPPVLHSDEYEDPVPFDAVNTAGAEDSPFIPADRDEIYFFFTPDTRVPAEKQLLDGVTGIYVSKRNGGVWSKPERVVLQKSGKLSLDGCEFVNENMIWFCSAREGYTGIHWFSAEYADGKWSNWKNSDFDPAYEVGELHFSRDWNDVYFHSSREGSNGSQDIWVSRKSGGKWQEPQNVAAVNSAENEGMPYLTPDGNELWFHRWHKGTPAILRSRKLGGVWQEPEMIISQFAGEPTLDSEGNLYFVHHYYKDSKMIEADIYVAYKKK